MTRAHDEADRRGTGRGEADWLLAARRLAEGASLREVAEEIGRSPAQISRRRRNDPAFEARIERCRQLACVDSKTRGADLRRAIRATIENEVVTGNVRVALWAAQKLRMLDGASPGSGPEPHASGSAVERVLRGLTPEQRARFEALGRDSG